MPKIAQDPTPEGTTVESRRIDELPQHAGAGGSLQPVEAQIRRYTDGKADETQAILARLEQLEAIVQTQNQLLAQIDRSCQGHKRRASLGVISGNSGPTASKRAKHSETTMEAIEG